MNNKLIANLRLYLWGALALLLLYDYQAWMRDFAPPPGTSTTAAPTPSGAKPSDLGTHLPEIPSTTPAPAATGAGTPAAGATSAAAPAQAAAAPQESTAQAPAPVLRVRTDVLDLDISTRGGTIERADLLAYPQVKGEAARVRLQDNDSPQTLYLLQSGLEGPAGGVYPTHLQNFTSEKSDYSLDGGNELRVPLTWTSDGITVTKTYVFRRGSYAIDVQYEVHNNSGAPWQVLPYAQIERNDPPTKRSYFNVESYAFHGPALWDGTKFRSLDISKPADAHLSLDVRDGWVAALQHHFVSVVVPPKGQNWHFGLNVDGTQYLLDARGPLQTVAPGDSAQFSTTLFVGPKLQQQLTATSPELGHVADYGRLWLLARPLFLALSWVHKLTGNWGVAIILVTFLLKLLFYPLSEASGRSMAKMKTLQPRIKNLQETYADDREKLGRAMMELYKREKVNPLASCLPVVIQIPVFIAFYWVLLESVEMR
ncbi:MAG TPA: membrane protein insertase YidC, partial [Steroidobacteraceae bacterium]|nr:membrane protein insertase YidC [Steroidobacteraceae bacterium]